MGYDRFHQIEDSWRLSIPQSKMYLWAKRFFLLSVLLKPFYIFSSGSLQISDVMLIISLFALVFESKRIHLRKQDEPLYVFVLCVILIQGIYTVIFQKPSLMVIASYYIFNLAVVYIFNWFVEDNAFLRKLQKVLVINLLVQLGLYFLGYGGSRTRYQGTFNDPNQLSFYCMINFFLIYIIDYIFEKRNQRRSTWWPWFAVAIYVIYLASSSSMLAGMVAFVVFYFLENATNFSSKRQIAAITVVIIMVIFVFLIMTGVVQLPDSITEGNRVYDKFERMFNVESIAESFTNFAEDRCLYPLLYYPQRILYGAGEGLGERYVGLSRNEIHSTPLAILFYYGIIPWSFWVLWIVRKMKFVPRPLLCVYAALIIETFTLVNHRQPLFWVMLLLAETAGKAGKDNKA